MMRRLSRTAAIVLVVTGWACTVDRSGEGSPGESGGSNVDQPTSGTKSGSGGTSAGASIGASGVFGVAMGNAGESSGTAGAGNEQHEAGNAGTGGAAVEPPEGGSTAVDASGTDEASTAPEASSTSSCANHAGGKTFTPSGAASAHCYWPLAGKSSWQAALDACAAQGGHLATLASDAETNVVVKLFANLTTNDRIWLGGTDKKNDTDTSGGGPYLWITGEPFDYTPWAMGNPDGNCTATCNGKPCECQHRVCVDKDGIIWDRWENETYYAACESEP